MICAHRMYNIRNKNIIKVLTILTVLGLDQILYRIL